MEKKGFLTQTLATTGTVLVWLPLLAPVFISLARIITGIHFMFDYLMPAELFPLYLVGALLLVWAALRARKRQKIIAWSLAAALIFLISGQIAAFVTGLASGEIEPVGWQWALVLVSLVANILCMIITGVSGALLLRDLLRSQRPVES